MTAVAANTTPAPSSEEDEKAGSPLAATITLVIAVAMSVAILFGNLPRPLIGTLAVLIAIALILIKVHTGIAMILGGVIGLYGVGGFKVVAGTFQDTVYNAVASWQLSVIPMFVLMGILLWRGRITDGAYTAARQWLGKLPGGIAIATTVAGAGLAASSGSSVGISYALGRIAIPEMLKSGYKPTLATGVVASVGTLGQLMPPAILLVIYAGIAETSVGTQLLAAIVPALILALAFALTVVAWVLIRPSVAPRLNIAGITWGTRFRSLVKVIPLTVVIICVLGGLFSGVFTATEAGAAGVFVALAVAWITAGSGKRGIRRWSQIVGSSLLQTAGSTASIFLLMIGVLVLNRIVTLSQIPQMLSEWIGNADLNRVTLLLVLLVVYLVLGTALEPLAMMLLTVPVLVVPLAAAGVDMVWFGIFIVILAEIAILSPPIGTIVFVVLKIAQEKAVNLGQKVTLNHVFIGVTPFMIAGILVCVMLIFFPQIVLWLPEISSVK
jgi:tripartite ATP-independent transporter DctM subunit